MLALLPSGKLHIWVMLDNHKQLNDKSLDLATIVMELGLDKCVWVPYKALDRFLAMPAENAAINYH